MIRELYAPNYEERRQDTFLRAAGRCENSRDGQRCPHRLGTLKISHAHNLYFEPLLIHHPNDDPWNPDAEMIAVCASCHMKLHRMPDANGKIPARKPGYKVISLNHLLCRLATTVGLTIEPHEECRVHWSLGPFEAEAADPPDAICMAMHWLAAEVRDLQTELAGAQAENLRLTEAIVRSRCAEEKGGAALMQRTAPGQTNDERKGKGQSDE